MLNSVRLAKLHKWEDVANETGFKVETYLGSSTIPEAGLGRFVATDIKKGDIVRVQKIGDKTLECYASETDMAARIARDGIQYLEYFGHTGPQARPETRDLVFVNNPPLYSNHCTGAAKNIETVWDGDVKYIRATRDISPGEELMEDYRSFGEVGWFEAFLVLDGRVPVRQLGEMLG